MISLAELRGAWWRSTSSTRAVRCRISVSVSPTISPCFRSDSKRGLVRDLVLLTVTFDPVHDTPEVLAKYSEQWKANPAAWHFLTGSEADVQRVCRMFGVQAFPNEGLMDHSLHTVLIDRQGKLAANLEGNRFTASQLGDLTEGILGRR